MRKISTQNVMKKANQFVKNENIMIFATGSYQNKMKESLKMAYRMADTLNSKYGDEVNMKSLNTAFMEEDTVDYMMLRYKMEEGNISSNDILDFLP